MSVSSFQRLSAIFGRLLLMLTAVVATSCSDNPSGPELRTQKTLTCFDNGDGGGGGGTVTRPQGNGFAVQFDWVCIYESDDPDDPNECTDTMITCGEGSAGGTNGPSEPPIYIYDGDAEAAEPDCSKPQTEPYKREKESYCAGMPVLSTGYATAFKNALARLRTRGAECTRIADAAEKLANAKKLRIFNQKDFPEFGGNAPRGGDWATLGHWWFTTYDGTKTSAGLNLDGVIAHEMDHHLKNFGNPGDTDAKGHLYIDGEARGDHTVNSKQCAG